MTFESLARTILARPCAQPVRLVGIDGGAGAGKTTFAAELAKHLGEPPIIPMDDFNSFDDLEGYWPRLEEQLLKPLFMGRTARYQKRDWVGDMAGRGLKDWREVTPCDLVILEGIGACRKELGDRLSYGIWIEVPEAERLRRGLLRDEDVEGIERIWRDFMPGERRFFEASGSRGRCELEVDGLKPWGSGPAFFGSLRPGPA